MFRYACFLVVLISTLSFQFVSAQKKAKTDNRPAVFYFYDGGKGKLEYPVQGYSPDGKNEFVVWSEKDSKGGKFGLTSGLIDANTKVVFVNKEFRTEGPNFLSLMNDKMVSVTGRFRREGDGEGAVVYCEELFIAVTKY